jgi:hypothetical protein
MLDINRAAPVGRNSAQLIAVQPREITEAAFRSLSAAGADPSEAQEGALAVLRAESETHAGLALLNELLDADWNTSERPTLKKDTAQTGATVVTLSCPGQPPLRTALQLLDLACCGAESGTRLALANDSIIPELLWIDLLMRLAVSRQRRLVIAVTGPATNPIDSAHPLYLTVHDGTVTRTPEMIPEAAVTHIPRTSTRQQTVVMALPGPLCVDQRTHHVPSGPLSMQEKDWQAMYQLSRKFLVQDA